MARLVVAADGARSRLRDWAELRTLGFQYGQSGLVATVECEPNHTAWQRFLSTGPIALLPTRCAIVNYISFPSSSWSCQCPCGCGAVVKRYISRVSVNKVLTFRKTFPQWFLELPMSMWMRYCCKKIHRHLLGTLILYSVFCKFRLV